MVAVIKDESEKTRARIKKYSGKNSESLLKLYQNAKGKYGEYIRFILDNCSINDLAVFTESYLDENVQYAIKSKKFNYVKDIPEDIFKHFVLCHRMTQEPLERWRKEFYEELKEKVKAASDLIEAAIIVNLWCLEKMTFIPTNRRDQAPLTTIKRGYGRCEEAMIIYMAAARSVGIPVRSAYVPLWNFTDNNHAWVELWTPEGWKYLGEPNPSVNDTWFTQTTKRATIVLAHSFGNYNSKNAIKQNKNVTMLNSIQYYNESTRYDFRVIDEKGNPVTGAKIYLYGVSYGGLLPMLSIVTDKNGKANLSLGKGTVFLTVYKDKKFGYKLFNMLRNKDEIITITISKEKVISENFNFLFSLPAADSVKDEHKKYFVDKFDLLRENADLKRKDRFNKLKLSNSFIKYYDLVQEYKGLDELNKPDLKKEFFDKVDTLGENAPLYLEVFKSLGDDKEKILILVYMIKKWDIKDLIEIPTKEEIVTVVDIYDQGWERFKKEYDAKIFVENVIPRTLGGNTPCENGWQAGFYKKIKKLAGSDIEETVQNVLNWVDANLIIEADFELTYYSGEVNPLDILNMKYTNNRYRTVVINAALKQLGIPLRWRGRLEYYKNGDFIAIEKEEKTAIKEVECKLKITIFVDGNEVKAKPWENFLLTKLTDEGIINYFFFDGENEGLSYQASYLKKKDEEIYLEAAVRNNNGDANVIIKPIKDGLQGIKIELKTPKEYLNNSNKWGQETKKSIKKYAKGLDKSYKLLIIRGMNESEPEVRMLKEITDKVNEFKERKFGLILYSELRNNQDIANKEVYRDFVLKSGQKIIQEGIKEGDYPVIFVLNKNDELIFSSTGYHMGIADLILKNIS